MAVTETAMWNETAKHFSHTVDKLGKKIDPGIFDTVVALNMLGVHTVASCEGHLGWGVPHPWVNIEAELEQKLLLHQYLAQFYEGKSINFDHTLTFHGYRLRSQGAAFYELLSTEEQKQQLAAYQKEMASFTTFLKSLLH